jgi:hypothetical protein
MFDTNDARNVVANKGLPSLSGNAIVYWKLEGREKERKKAGTTKLARHS